MTDAHCHVSCGERDIRELMVGRDFVGVHPWETLGDAKEYSIPEAITPPCVGIGEIGLDRLRVREVPQKMRETFERQLLLALRLGAPVVLHGAKCWGDVVKTVQRMKKEHPSKSKFLFHGFSRSDGLIPDIVALGGFISVGPAVLNDHAVNYRALVRKIPVETLLVETDRTIENAAECPSVRDVLRKVAELRGVDADEIERVTDANAERFLENAK